MTDYYNNKVLHNFEEYSRTEQFLSLSATQLARYLASDSLRIRSESVLYDLVGKWYVFKAYIRIQGLYPYTRLGMPPTPYTMHISIYMAYIRTDTRLISYTRLSIPPILYTKHISVYKAYIHIHGLYPYGYKAYILYKA